MPRWTEATKWKSGRECTRQRIRQGAVANGGPLATLGPLLARRAWRKKTGGAILAGRLLFRGVAGRWVGGGTAPHPRVTPAPSWRGAKRREVRFLPGGCPSEESPRGRVAGLRLIRGARPRARGARRARPRARQAASPATSRSARTGAP